MLVGHVTKDGAIAGPRLLEHLVDVVLHFEGDRHSRLRLVRAVKNRFGPADEVGCFDLCDDGIVGLADPWGLFLSQQREAVPGTCVTVTVEGQRPLVAEVQSLVGRRMLNSRGAPPAVSTPAGWPWSSPFWSAGPRSGRACDVYASTVGGVRLAEPATDLAVALAVAGAAKNDALATGLVADRRGRPGRRDPPGHRHRAAGSPRPPGSVSPMPWCRPTPAGCRAGSRPSRSRDLPHALRVAFPGAEVIPFASRRR